MIGKHTQERPSGRKKKKAKRKQRKVSTLTRIVSLNFNCMVKIPKKNKGVYIFPVMVVLDDSTVQGILEALMSFA